MAAEFDDFKYPDPIQGDPKNRTTRQTGLPRSAMVGFDPTPPPPIIQGDPLTVVTRNQGPQHFLPDGTQMADHRSDDRSILYVDGALGATGDENPPPGLARTNAPLSPPSSFGEMLAAGQAIDRAALKAAAEAAGFTVSDSPVEVKDAPGTFRVVQADQPFAVIASDEGAHDPRDMSTGPQVLSSLPVVKKRPIVPVTTTVARVKKGKK
jgi:hypothetical protein